MKKAFVTLIALATLSSGAILNAANVLIGTEGEGKNILDTHNTLRGQHCDDCGIIIPPLQWDPRLVFKALKLAQYIENPLQYCTQNPSDKCEQELDLPGQMLHRSQTKNPAFRNNRFPENLAMKGGSNPALGTINGTVATQNWYNEIDDVNWQEPGTRQQLSGDRSGPIGHFTQVVWKDATKIGCAVTDIMPISGMPFGQILVCNYDEGNFTLGGPGETVISGYQHNVFPKCEDKLPRPTDAACPEGTPSAPIATPTPYPAPAPTVGGGVPTTETVTQQPEYPMPFPEPPPYPAPPVSPEPEIPQPETTVPAPEVTAEPTPEYYLEPVTDVPGYEQFYRVTVDDLCLDVVDDALKNKTHQTECGQNQGQFWYKEDRSSTEFTLRNFWQDLKYLSPDGTLSETPHLWRSE